MMRGADCLRYSWGKKNCLFSGRVDDFVVFLSAFVDSIPVELLVLTAQVTRTEPFSGHFFTLPRQTFSPRSYLSSSARPSLLFFITPVSFCYCPGAFSFILCLHQGWTRRWERGGGARNRRVSQHGSVSFINRFSRRDALKANSEPSLPAQQTKSPAPPSLLAPLSPFTNRYLSESDCAG